MAKQTSLLLVDDEELNLISLKAFFADQGYTVEIAENGKIALELFDRQRQNSEPFDLVITDLRMPVMNGQELIARLLVYDQPPLILIQSVVDDVSQVVDLMKKGVYDYLLKPYHLDELEHRIKNAIDFASLSKVKRNLEHDRDLRLDQQLKWNRWRDQLFVKAQIKSDSTIVHNIRTSFTQGGGFGVLLSLLQIIEQQAQKTEGGYLIDNDLMDMIFSNAKTASSVIEKLVEIDSVYDTQFTDESISAFDLQNQISNLANDLSGLSALKKNHIIVGDLGYIPGSLQIQIDSNQFMKAIRELLLNAMKFSVERTEIFVAFQSASQGIRISVLNEPTEDQFGNRGILPEYATIIFDLFYRISKHVYEEYGSHDFGLGLTLVDRIIRRMGGSISAYNVKNHLRNDKADLLVNFEIELKIAAEK